LALIHISDRNLIAQILFLLFGKKNLDNTVHCSEKSNVEAFQRTIKAIRKNVGVLLMNSIETRGKR
jgi:hypothetical protein